MNETDQAIVEYFHALGRHDGEYPVSRPIDVHAFLVDIRGDLEKSPSTISRHMGKLADAGVLDRYDQNRGQYCLTDLGWRLAEGELTDQERDELSDEFLS